MPTNLYGPGDNFDLDKSHVLPALLAKTHAAKQEGRSTIVVWGSGKPRREFLHVDDLADACVFLAKHYSGELPINVGCGDDLSIRDLAELIARVVGWDGKLLFDPTKPDGTPRKLLDVSRLSQLGWRPRIGLEEGIRSTYEWFLEHHADARGVHHLELG
jgi:GDP-L-fucose synthase